MRNATQQANPARPPLRILRLPEVEQKVGLKKSQIYELMAAGHFPKALKLTKTASGWLEHEVDGFILKRAEARETPPQEALG